MARFHSLWLNNIPLCSYTKHIFIHASMDEHSGGFHVLAIGNNATVDIGAHICCRISAFVFFRRIPRKWNCWIIRQFYFYFLRHSHTFLHSIRTNLQSHQEDTRAPFSPHPCQCFYLLSLMITILTVVGWCLIVALMCLSLMMNDAEHLFTFASLFITERCCIKISCYDDGFISLLFLQAKCLQVYNNYNFCMNWPFNLGTHCIPHKYFLS